MNRPIDPLLHDAEADTWPQRNQQWLSQRLAHWCALIEQHADSATPAGAGTATLPLDEADFEPSAWQVRDLFGLTGFETELLLLAAGVEIDTHLQAAVARAQGVAANQPVRLRFSLALALLPQPHWDALSPSSPLRHWRLIEVDLTAGLDQAALRADERVLHFLTGVPAFDEALVGIARIERGEAESAELTALAGRVAACWSGEGRAPIAIFANALQDAAHHAAARSLAAMSFGRVGLGLMWVDAAAFASADARDAVLLARRIDREALLSACGVAIALDGDGASPVLLRLIAQLRSPLILLGSPGPQAWTTARSTQRFKLPAPAQEPLQGRPSARQHAMQRTLEQFRVEPELAQQALAGVADVEQEDEAERQLWDSLRESARGGLDGLAQRIESQAGFEDLVLPHFLGAQLREIAGQLRHRRTVYKDWGFAARHSRGLGIAALFTGESGTGKTLAAEVIANEARLDLYRIDLASVVSKYIGETEKNLGKLFDAAERSGAVLLFDEADALFGKRSEVKDSHDRYANIEVAYLLQRIESYRGLAILTSNLKSSLDRAFLRRIRFVLHFPFPDAAARTEIWRRAFPAQAPCGPLDWAALAKLQLSGGHIRSIALNAAFRAAERGAAIEQADVMASARAEFSKLERVFNADTAKQVA